MSIENHPSAAKAALILQLYGTSKLVPFQNIELVSSLKAALRVDAAVVFCSLISVL